MNEISRSSLETVRRTVQTRLLALEETMRKYINVAVMLFVLGMCAAPPWAQLEGIIRGTVKGQDGKPLAGATIQMYDSQTGTALLRNHQCERPILDQRRQHRNLQDDVDDEGQRHR